MDRNSKQFRDRVNAVLAEERKTPLRWFYCSFADDDGFLGALFIEGHGPAEIMIRSHRLGLNPGGEMLCADVSNLSRELPEMKWRNRLLSKEEMEQAVGPLVDTDGKPAKKAPRKS